MKHAEVKLDGYTIPLIGIAPKYTTEVCDLCGKQFGLHDVEIQESGQILCKKCSLEKS